ncbi:exodeoxyribonuclease III [Rhodothalassium salexigens]|uniref:exodeoxyribonuclease III n=1 Tax=Rhodothalassium salexigens TaxID=1086 RepID=UPI0019147DE1|nr:exodeoxyribonuclease III [Rhodothalassium salexigens]MBK5910816.1 exodeoxyribonuclease III [Rhodothalassium salexigens]
MGAFRLITWNVNSVRARLEQVARLSHEQRPHILCLQETKVDDNGFPHKAMRAAGYRHVCPRGQRMHHGVAILARVPVVHSYSLDWCGKGDARHIAVRLESGVEVHCFYVPAGGDEPDPETNPRFAHKLAFLDEMRAWAETLDRPVVLVGDLNVAPLETDVWSHKQLRNVISHTPPERTRLDALLAAHDWVDAMRAAVPAEHKLFTWWSYRARDWQASNRGRRLDHIWVSRPLMDRFRTMRVLDDVRDWPRPSDHAPVLADFDDL